MTGAGCRMSSPSARPRATCDQTPAAEAKAVLGTDTCFAGVRVCLRARVFACACVLVCEIVGLGFVPALLVVFPFNPPPDHSLGCCGPPDCAPCLHGSCCVHRSEMQYLRACCVLSAPGRKHSGDWVPKPKTTNHGQFQQLAPGGPRAPHSCWPIPVPSTLAPGSNLLCIMFFMREGGAGWGGGLLWSGVCAPSIERWGGGGFPRGLVSLSSQPCAPLANQTPQPISYCPS
jgi:hypothetical protein